jgi:hypothetical protein
MAYLFHPVNRPRLAGMGDAASDAASSTTATIHTADVLSLGDQLRQAQADLSNLLTLMMQNPDLAKQIGPQATAQQAVLGDLISKYVGAYTAIFGTPPVGLGQVQVVAAVAVILAYVGAQLYLWYQKQKVLDEQAQASMVAEQNRSSILTQAAAMQQSANQKAASGDSAGSADDQLAANALFSQAGTPGTPPPPPPQPQGLLDWIKANALLVGGIAAAVFVVPRVLDR